MSHPSTPYTQARYVKEAADELHLRFKGVVPHTASELQRLPGVGPKIAHLVASVAFGLDRSGIVVDTHVRRLSERLGWTSGRACATAEATRVRLEGWLPPELWAETTLLLVGFGQAGSQGGGAGGLLLSCLFFIFYFFFVLKQKININLNES